MVHCAEFEKMSVFEKNWLECISLSAMLLHAVNMAQYVFCGPIIGNFLFYLYRETHVDKRLCI